MNREEREAARLIISRDAIITEARAAELLPCSDVKAREWLRAKRLVRNHPVLGRVVVWEDVIAAVRECDQPEDPPPRRPTGYPREVLRGQRGR